MTRDELALHDAADRIRIVRAALDEEHRGRKLKAEQCARLDGFDANIARLERRLAEAWRDHADALERIEDSRTGRQLARKRLARDFARAR